MIAVILAAGRGTRMGALTATTPKPLLSLAGRPIIEHIIDGIRSAGIGEIAIVTGYRGEQLEARLGSGDAFGVRLHYRRQEVATGTAHALLLARDLIDAQPFVLSWGDVVVAPAHYAALLSAFRRSPCDALLTVNEIDDPWRGAAVYVDSDWRVTRLVEKPPRGTSRTPWNNAGVFVLTPLILSYADGLSPSARGEYELPQALSAMLAAGCTVRALPVRGFWRDLGTPDDLAAAERGLAVAESG